MLGNFTFFFLSSADFYFEVNFSKKSFRNALRVSNSLDADQDRQFVRPDLGPNYWQRISADNTGKQRVKQAASV